MTSHTPGPWTVETGVCRNDHPDTSADVLGADGGVVADCGCHGHAIANAHLIAAAPELLDALKELRLASLLYGSASDAEMDAAFARLLHARNVAHLAIVKAEPRCDHKFIDSTSCLKCGWTPPASSCSPTRV